MDYPQSFIKLIESFERLPSIGKKSAERLAMHLVTNYNDEQIQSFSQALINLKELKRCDICGNLTDTNICSICSDESRDKDIIMVVETIKDVFTLEKVKTFTGVYHILNGAINFANGIGIEDIDIKGLLARISQRRPKEIILATNANVEGETTARYLKKILEKEAIVITRIAYGLPVGGHLQYADEMTLLKALEGRRDY